MSNKEYQLLQTSKESTEGADFNEFSERITPSYTIMDTVV